MGATAAHCFAASLGGLSSCNGVLSGAAVGVRRFMEPIVAWFSAGGTVGSSTYSACSLVVSVVATPPSTGGVSTSGRNRLCAAIVMRGIPSLAYPPLATARSAVFSRGDP